MASFPPLPARAFSEPSPSPKGSGLAPRGGRGLSLNSQGQSLVPEPFCGRSPPAARGAGRVSAEAVCGCQAAALVTPRGPGQMETERLPTVVTNAPIAPFPPRGFRKSLASDRICVDPFSLFIFSFRKRDIFLFDHYLTRKDQKLFPGFFTLCCHQFCFLAPPQ